MTTTKSIINLWPRIPWCYVHWWTPLCMNMVLVMDKPILELKFSSVQLTPLRFRCWRPFLLQQATVPLKELGSRAWAWISLAAPAQLSQLSLAQTPSPTVKCLSRDRQIPCPGFGSPRHCPWLPPNPHLPHMILPAGVGPTERWNQVVVWAVPSWVLGGRPHLKALSCKTWTVGLAPG